ncbi:MAG: hypothetical protein B7Z38_00795 [Rhodobacterales bacterium 12-64-8]|nr:MAG: hypothetical protein B7Z38_00795 [Rhodobacterales bacterium 12-64-8]
MSKAVVHCPDCKQGHSLPPERRGDVRCRRCGRAFAADTRSGRTIPIIEIDLSKAPPPPRALPALLVHAVTWGAITGLGVFLGLLIWAGVIRLVAGWALSIVNPSWEQSLASLVAPFDAVFARGSPYGEVAMAAGAGGCAAIGAVLMAVHMIRLRNWRVPHHDVPIKTISARLRRLAARGRFAGRSRYVWGWLFLTAFLVAIIAPLVARMFNVNLFAIAWALFPADEDARAKGVTATAYLLLLAVLLLIGLWLLLVRTTARRHLLSILLRIAPFVAAPLAFLLFSATIFVLHGLEPFPAQVDSSSPAFLLATLGGVLFAFATLFGLINWLYPHAHDLAQPLAQDAMRSDRRSPIVFLRSFQDDFRIVKTGEEGDSASIGEMLSKDEIGFEGVMSDISKPFGPFIAIAKPGSAPSAEAARAYFAGEEWRDAVVQWMDESRLILMIAGYTDGLNWELGQTIQRGHAGKIVFLFPPNDPYTDARWAWVKAAFRDHQVAHMMTRTAPLNVIGLHLDATGALIVLRSEKKLSRNYRAALAVAFYGMMDQF